MSGPPDEEADRRLLTELHQLVRVAVEVSVDEIVQKLGAKDKHEDLLRFAEIADQEADLALGRGEEEPALVGRAMAAAIRVRARAVRRTNS